MNEESERNRPWVHVSIIRRNKSITNRFDRKFGSSRSSSPVWKCETATNIEKT